MSFETLPALSASSQAISAGRILPGDVFAEETLPALSDLARGYGERQVLVTKVEKSSIVYGGRDCPVVYVEGQDMIAQRVVKVAVTPRHSFLVVR